MRRRRFFGSRYEHAMAETTGHQFFQKSVARMQRAAASNLLGIFGLSVRSPAPDAVMLMFVGTCAMTFGIGATLTGLAITLTEDPDTTRRE